MGTPMMALNSNGKKVWSQTLDIFGRNTEKSTNFVPFRYQGQYYDEETGLSYNRFRYYDDSTGQYISQDPIGLAGGNPTIYGYVKNTNEWIDAWGLYVIIGNATAPADARVGQDIFPNEGGIIKAQVGTDDVTGKSIFNKTDDVMNGTNLTGHVYETVGDVTMPEGLAIKADGSDVIPGSNHSPGHNTIYNTRDMSVDEFNSKLNEFYKMNDAQDIGTIKKNKKTNERTFKPNH